MGQWRAVTARACAERPADGTQILVLLDEVDKCSHRTVNAAPIQAALLGLLEPESSRNLHVPCDLSNLPFIATENLLRTIDAALMSRLHLVMVPTPDRRHSPAIIEQVVRDVTNDWGLPCEVMPALNVSGIAQAAESVRNLPIRAASYSLMQ
jgi:MoxR-like ATPase